MPFAMGGFENDFSDEAAPIRLRLSELMFFIRLRGYQWSRAEQGAGRLAAAASACDYEWRRCVRNASVPSVGPALHRAFTGCDRRPSTHHDIHVPDLVAAKQPLAAAARAAVLEAIPSHETVKRVELGAGVPRVP